MNFSCFARILYSYIGAGSKYPEYIENLFRLVVPGYDELGEKNINPFYKMNSSTLNSYFRGSKKISEKNAGFLKTNFTPAAFIDKLDSLSVDVKPKLAEELKLENVDITEIPDKCSDLFLEILSDIASGKKEQTSLNTNLGKKDLEQKYGLSLLQECNSICPLPECSKPLYIKKDKEQHPFFQIIQIDPEKPDDRFYNLLAVCPECSARLSMEKSFDDVLKLAQIKQKMQKNEEVTEIASQEKIEQDITSLMQQITSVDESLLVKLNYKPVELERKFLPSEHMLKDSIKQNVVKYFNFITDLFKQKVENGSFDEKKFRIKVKHIFENLDSENFSKEEIFEAISDRFYNMTKASRMSCNILASYFVQTCEIFKPVEEK